MAYLHFITKFMTSVLIVFYAFSAYPMILKEGEISEISFLDFTGVDDYFTLNGDTAIVTDQFSSSTKEKMILRLTARTPNPEGLIAGSAFLKIPFIYTPEKNYSFSTFFRFRITRNEIYDGSGIVFVLQSDIRKDKALGKSSQGMGYAGNYIRGFKSISPSIGVKFNVQIDEDIDIDYNTVGTVQNGNLQALYPPYGNPVAETQLNNSIPWNVWVDYDGANLTIRTTQSPDFSISTLHTNRSINLKDILTQNTVTGASEPPVYIGFTADPGINPAYHDILEWHFRPFYKPFGDYCGDAKDDRPTSCKN
jgi:hypothetical protein